MASTQRLPSGRWRGRFRIDGEQYTKTFDYQYEARQWAEDGESRATPVAAPIAATAAHVAPAPTVSQATVAEYGRQWLARTAHEREATSNSWTNTQLKAITASRLGRMPIAAVTKTDVQLWMGDQAGVPAPTRKARLKVLRSVMRDAVANEAALRDATAGIKMPKIEKRPPVNPKADKLTTLLAACDDDTRLIVLLALDAGLRWGEAAGMPVEAVVLDGDNPRMWVGQVALRNRTIRGYTKGHKARWLPITTDRLADALKARAAVVSSGLLVTAPNGKPLSYWVSRDKWHEARSAAGMPGLRFHDLRHVFGSDMGNEGMPRRDIMTLLGHADEATTAGYLHGNEDAAIFARARKAKAAGR